MMAIGEQPWQTRSEEGPAIVLAEALADVIDVLSKSAGCLARARAEGIGTTVLNLSLSPPLEVVSLNRGAN